jgi:cytochrome P450
VLYYTYVIHRRKDIFGEDAEEFRPERWAEARPDWGYLPFNAGPRICVGRTCSTLIPGSLVVQQLTSSFCRTIRAD